MDDWYEMQGLVLFPLGGVVPTFVIACLSVIALGARGAWRRAAMLVVMLLVVLGVGVATKFACHAWDVHFALGGFRGASGHALDAAAVYPTFTWIVFAGSSRRRMAAAVVVGALLAWMVMIAAIGSTAHSPAEALAGVLIGASVPIATARAGQLKCLSSRLQSLMVACAIAMCAIVAIHGQQLGVTDRRVFALFASVIPPFRAHTPTEACACEDRV